MGESLSQEEEAELDKLMAAADSGFGKVGPSRNDVEGSEFYDTLKSAMHMMGHGSADTDKSMFEDPESIAQFEAMTKHIMEAQGVFVGFKRTVDCSQSGIYNFLHLLSWVKHSC